MNTYKLSKLTAIYETKPLFMSYSQGWMEGSRAIGIKARKSARTYVDAPRIVQSGLGPA
jgi:hypothetical protein